MNLSEMGDFCNDCDYAPALCDCEVSECIKRGKPPTEENENDRLQRELVQFESDAVHKYGI